jgi:hypothetical protein
MKEKTKWELYLEKQESVAKDNSTNIESVDNSDKSVKPWDLLNPNEPRASEDLSKFRYDICKSCPELFSLTKQCRRCGCFMAAKTKLQHASCPIGKW